MHNAPLGAFCNTFDLHLVLIGLENQFLGFLREAILHRFYCNVLIKASSLSAGFELTFFSGVYGTCISNNLWYGGEAKGLIGISGIFIGVGEILGKFCVDGHGSR